MSATPELDYLLDKLFTTRAKIRRTALINFYNGDLDADGLVRIAAQIDSGPVIYDAEAIAASWSEVIGPDHD